MIVATLRDSITIEGVGIHSGKFCRVTINPGHTGADCIRFLRNGVEIPAFADSVVDTSRCTRIGEAGESVSTIEHLMSAFAGLGVLAAKVEVEGPELPVLDGSAQGWVDVLKPQLVLKGGLSSEPILEKVIVEGKNGSYITATPSDRLRITLSIIYDHPVIGTQTATFVEGEDDYVTEIAPARTFGLRAEVDALLAAGLAKGGSLDNAIVVEEDGYSTPLRFPNELARHKILDLLGDLYLSGSLPRADIIAVKPSHTLNVALAAKLLEASTR